VSTPIAITGAGTATAPALDDLAEPVRARAARTERVSQLALAAADAALLDAGLRLVDGEPRAGIGVVIGTAFGCFLTNAAYQHRVAAGGSAAASPRLFAATVSNAAAGEIGVAYRLGGPAITLTAGGAAGLVALGHAADLLQAGQAGALVAGGVDAAGDALAAWQRAGGLDAGRPSAEAAALLVLERPDAAAARGARVRGTILGHAAGFEQEPEAPDAGAALAAAVAAALADACVPPSDVAAVALGAPPRLAALEARAIETLRGAARLAPKDAGGESFGASGPLGLLAALHAVAPGAAVVVLDVCATGHVAALVARRGDA
jgi:3-oxoacyl-[acyl-carrier-protein] synthase II